MTLIYFLIVIGILVFVHEFGHFIMAKRAGVRVEKFSLGMGPKIAGFKKGDTEYVLSALPLGGYVKMAGENPDEEPTGAADEFQSKTVWQRVKIAATGPLTNIVLAFLIMPIVFMVGTYSEGPAKVGYVEPGSPAEHSGFLAGDLIEKIDGRSISDWTEALSLIAVNPNTDVTVLVDRQGKQETLTLRPATATELKIGMSGLIPDMPAEIGKLKPGFPAEKAGISVNDKVLAVDGKTIYHWNQFSTIVRDSKGKKLALLIERGGKRIEKTVTPIEDSGRFVIGVEPVMRLVFKKYGFLESIRLGFDKTIESIDLTFITLKKLVTFGLSIKTLGGPVMIAQMSGQAASAGLSSFLSLLAMISISLGILNLLPIPVLDGGLILFLVIEAIRKKPVSRKVMEVSQSIGAAVLITLIAVVSYNDIMRMFFSK
ncbi:MAG: RIP metalloprotease RseP [Nitrospiraceae bacterium]|nr:RIP metalloprotease RseP [Nitrospiraceae bacterium]